MGQKKIIFLVLSFFAYSSGVPVPVEETTIIDDIQEGCTVKNVTYAKGEEIPDLTPCETCSCDPPNVVCAMVKCQSNNGCKIIQQPNRCCPEYKCECELEGKTYNNGEKLDNSLDPCQVCYCRGGEIMCTSITCYHRDDCPPVNIPGRCCPKYDHCPPESAPRSSNASNQTSKREMQPWLMTKGVEVVSSPSPNEAQPQKFPQTIKIVEILPTAGVEPSSGPRIITNGDDHRKPEVEVLSYTTSPNTTNTTDDSTDLSLFPDSEYYTTIVPQEVNSTEYTTQTSIDIEEGSGYEILQGGVFETESTSEQSSSSLNLPNLDTSPLIKINQETAPDIHAPIIHIYSPSKPEEISEMAVVKAFSESPGIEDQTQPILLTPDDLRTLAEYLIHQKIKPAPVTENMSTDDTTQDNSVYEESTLSPKRNLTEKELWAQKVLDKITSNILLPMQGIELVPNELDNTTDLFDNTTEISTDFTFNQTDTSEIYNFDNLTSTDLSTVEETSKISTRGSLRQIQNLKSKTTNERKVENTPGILDEKDQMLVENFFKKNLDVN